ncbi:MAG: hypothetical protein CL811_10865 [Colwelliaceae bacterium]|nr:hypothetical protein [Colwelliaceae bacterium]|tara:strand:- start:170 stop:1276 length:1107 start_codon:yes stop_codon:yes gene_type:complete
MKNVSVIGIGKIGLCFALSLEKAGYNVVGCDVRKNYVNELNLKKIRTVEPGVEELLSNSKNFLATTEIDLAVKHAKTLFVIVATFSEPDGKYDVSYVDSVVSSLKGLGIQSERRHLVICSNVNPGYSDSVADRLKENNWDVSFNPETIAQGTILKNQSEPDCVYIGADSEELAHELREIYSNLCANKPSIHVMNRISAELTKISLNCFLTCKISFANMVGDLALELGAEPGQVLRAVGSDSRINNKFFNYGFGWGGPCFPRDTRAYIKVAKDNNIDYEMCRSANDSNRRHLEYQIQEFLLSGKKEYHTDSVTYKRGSYILEGSQQLGLALGLARNGVDVYIAESDVVIKELKALYGDLFIYEKRDSNN